MAQHDDDHVGQADSYEAELAAIDASIADLKIRDMAAAKERTQIASRLQAAQFQRDILAHAQGKREQQTRRPPRRSSPEAPQPQPQELSTEDESAERGSIQYDIEAQPEDYRIERTSPEEPAASSAANSPRSSALVPKIRVIVLGVLIWALAVTVGIYNPFAGIIVGLIALFVVFAGARYMEP